MNQCMNLHGAGIILHYELWCGFLWYRFPVSCFDEKIVYDYVVDMHMQTWKISVMKMDLVHQTVFPLERTGSGH